MRKPQIINRMRERRVTEKLRRYWSGLANSAATPCISSFSIGPRDSDWHNRFLLKEDLEAPRSVFIFCGKGAKPLFNSNPLAKSMVEVAPTHLRERLCRHCEDVTHWVRPADDEGSFWHQHEEVFYRYILLPVTAVSHDRGYIVGAFSSTLEV